MALALAAVALIAATTVTAAGPATVRCDSSIRPGGSYSWRPTRVVLGVAAVPPAYIPQTVPSGVGSWPYWSKSGLVVRAKSPPVTVTVPRRWRSRVAIGWGNVDAASSLRFATCRDAPGLEGWNPYAGGFLLRARSACVPLTFRSGGRRETVRFGVGRRCR